MWAGDAPAGQRSGLVAVRSNMTVIYDALLIALEDEARSRSLRDAHDRPLAACALALASAIWTVDDDLLGTGVATCTTQSLQVWLDRNSGEKGALQGRTEP